MRIWRDRHRQTYAERFVETEIFQGDEKCCSECDLPECVYRCTTCHGGARMSKDCLRKAHRYLPTHIIEVCRLACANFCC
jgi:hypothetical protein